MGAGAGFNALAAAGAQAGLDKIQRKRDALDEERRGKAEPLLADTKNLQAEISSYKDGNGNVIPQYQAQHDKAVDALTKTQQAWDELYHPVKAPGAAAQDFHWIIDKFKDLAAPKDKTPSSITSQTPAMTLNTPSATLAAPEIPAYQQTTPRLPSQGGNVTTTQPGVPAATIGPGMTPSAQPSTPLLVTQSFADKPVPGMVAKGNIDLSKRPNIDNGDGTHSSTFSMSFGTDKGEVLVPGVGDGKTYPARQLRVLYTLPDGSQKWAVPGNQPHNWIAPERPTPQNNEALNQYQKTGKFFMIFKDEDGKTAEQHADAYGKQLHEDQEKYGQNGVTAHPVSKSGNITIPAGSPVTVKKAAPIPWGQVQVLKQRAAAMQKAQQEAGLLAAGAPMSQGQAESALLQSREQSIKNDPNLSPEDKAEAIRKLHGVSEKPTLKLYSSPDGGTKAWLDASRPDTIPIGWTAYTSTSADANKRADYQAYLAKNPDYEKKGGTFEKWVAEQSTAGKGLSWDAATGQIKGGPDGRVYNSWDSDLPQDVKDKFKAQSDFMAKKQANALALAATRGSAAANARIIPVQDPNNPGLNIVVPAGLAYKLGYKVPSGAYYQAMEGMLKDATYGQIGNEFVAFGTALQHADQLQKAAIALNNGDSRTLNSIANGLSTAFGDPAVTNFDVVSQVYTGEITKAINAGHITQSELEDNHALIPANASPAQILGAINNFKTLLNSKINNRLPQIQSILGQFGMQTPFTPPGYTPPSGGAGGAGKFPVKIPGTNKTKFFPTQAAADLFKKEANIP